jgi:hypothetical protein
MQLLEDHLLHLISKGVIEAQHAINLANDSTYLTKELIAKGIIKNS